MPPTTDGFKIIAPKEIDVSACTEENGTESVSITNVAPSGVGTATISKWLKVRIEGEWYYIPLWT